MVKRLSWALAAALLASPCWSEPGPKPKPVKDPDRTFDGAERRKPIRVDTDVPISRELFDELSDKLPDPKPAKKEGRKERMVRVKKKSPEKPAPPKTCLDRAKEAVEEAIRSAVEAARRKTP